MKKLHVGLLGLVLLSGSAVAQTADEAPVSLGVYGVLGSGGVGLGLNLPLSPEWGVRGELVKASVSRNYTQDDISYRGDFDLSGSGLFADYRPFKGVFRLVAGLSMGATKADLLAEPANGQLTIDGQTFNAAGNSLSARIKYPSTMPYLGLGWGHGRTNAAGWTFGLDLGLAIGKPTVTLTASGDLLAQPGAPAAIAAEESRVQEDLNRARVLPVIKFSAGYSF